MENAEDKETQSFRGHTEDELEREEKKEPEKKKMKKPKKCEKATKVELNNSLKEVGMQTGGNREDQRNVPF